MKAGHNQYVVSLRGLPDRFEFEPVQTIVEPGFGQVLFAPSQTVMQIRDLRIPPFTMAAGLIKLETEREVPPESCQQTRLIMSGETVDIGAGDSGADDCRCEDRFSNGIADAIAAKWIKAERGGSARQPSCGAQRPGDTRMRRKASH